MGEPKSSTSMDSFIEDPFVGNDPHYKTVIKDNEKSVTARGRTAEEAEKRASDKWEDAKKK